mgnify:FL=1
MRCLYYFNIQTQRNAYNDSSHHYNPPAVPLHHHKPDAFDQPSIRIKVGHYADFL